MFSLILNIGTKSHNLIGAGSAYNRTKKLREWWHFYYQSEKEFIRLKWKNDNSKSSRFRWFCDWSW